MTLENLKDLKAVSNEVVQANASKLIALSHFIYEHPELCFAEVESAKAALQPLRDAGFQIEEPLCGIDTAWRASTGTGTLRIALCAEYDALEVIGHACGHNIIAASAVGAGLSLAKVADELDLTIDVIGTPAEEGGGGKVLLLERGAFEGVHAALMVHPWPENRLSARSLAVEHFSVTYTGKAAHASATPHEGINALDALRIADVAIGFLRQQFSPGDQVHGIVTTGGSAVNVIPEMVRATYMVRAIDMTALEILSKRVRACFEAGALAANATLSIEERAPVYTHMRDNPELLGLWQVNARSLGRTFPKDDAGAPLPTFSTDMANLSLAMPTIHPLLGIDANGAVNHQAAFADATITSSGDAAVIDGAISLAWTVIDAACTQSVRASLLGK